MSESSIHLYYVTPRQFKGRLAKPCRARAHVCIIRRCANADQKIIRQRLPRGYDRVITKKCVLPKPRWRNRYRASMHPRPAKINPVREETLITNLDELRYDIDDRADLAAASYLHSGEPQPHRPEDCPAEPLARRLYDLRLKQDSHV